MKAIVVICDPNRIDPYLMSSLQQLFPECEIKIVFKEKGDTEMYPIALTFKKAHG
ncbi:MAG: hypothetical protein WBR24_20960 [Desulfobacterales bacterium]|jgi:hypothetical protein